MTPDPKTTHNVEQAIASFRSIAGGFAVFYRELVAGEIHPDHALALTLEYMRGWWSSARQPPPPPKLDDAV